MKDDDRIAAIQKAANDEQLDKAMKGFLDHAVAAHPALRQQENFSRLLDTGQYMRALEQVRHAREQDQDAYLDVIRVLQFAEGRRLAIMMS
jgi:hypothetical protein